MNKRLSPFGLIVMLQIRASNLIKDIHTMIKGYFITSILLFSFTAIAADQIPYSVKSIKPIGAGYIELVAPGKIKVNGEITPFEGTKYISTKNINSMTDGSGTSKDCILHYSSENYTENISVITQSCTTIISIINIVNK